MRSISISILLAVVLLGSLTGCGEDAGTGADPGIDFAGNNGLVADGVLIGKVNFSGPGNADASSGGEVPMTRVTLGGIYYFDNIFVEIVFPSTTPGNYSWNNIFASNDPTSRSHVKVTISGSAETITLYAEQGSTVVKEYGGQGKQVTGEFSGTLKTEDGRNTVKLDGKFIAIRN